MGCLLGRRLLSDQVRRIALGEKQKFRAAITAQFGVILKENIHPTAEIDMKDFFISYNKADKQWAVWIAWQLEAAGYSVIIQEWDFRPGGNFVIEMQQAIVGTHKTIAVLSESYLKSSFTQPEWGAAFADDPMGNSKKLLPVKVQDCKPTGLLKQTIHVSLFGVNKATAQERLLGALKDRGKPDQPPPFPGDIIGEPISSELREIAVEPQFPSALDEFKKIKQAGLQSQYDNSLKNAEALAQQINYTSNLADKNALKNQLDSVYEEMEKIATSLDELNLSL